MRRKSRRQAKSRAYHDGHRQVLMHGYDFFGDFGDHEPGEDELRQAWSVLRGELVEEYTSQRPCSRPVAFWRYDIERDETKTEREQLAELGLLTKAEVKRAAELEQLRRIAPVDNLQ